MINNLIVYICVVLLVHALESMCTVSNDHAHLCINVFERQHDTFLIVTIFIVDKYKHISLLGLITWM